MTINDGEILQDIHGSLGNADKAGILVAVADGEPDEHSGIANGSEAIHPEATSNTSTLTSRDELQTAEYWREALASCECVPYPALPPFVDQPVADKVAEYQFSQPKKLLDGVTISTLVRAAWALITGRMTDSDDVVFGVPVSGRTAPLTTIPVRVKLIDNQKVWEYLKIVQQQAINMIPFERAGLDQIAKISSDCQKACMFQTLLVIQPQENSGAQEALRVWQDGNQLRHYGLIIQIQIANAQIKATATFDPRAIEPWLALKLLHRLEFVIQQLNNASPEMALTDIGIVPPQDVEQIWEWNSAVPTAVERCIHDIVLERTLAQPNAPAVCAWDGELTYRELDDLSIQIASHLVEFGVGPEKVVPLCFEKSMWTVVAMLAVLKAGGAFVLLDPALPENRVRNICQQVHAEIGITSASYESRLSPFTLQTVVLSRQTLESRYPKILPQIRKASPSNAAYIIFTSGSTGEPKGCVIEHRSYCSAAFGHGTVLGMSNSTRSLQFGSYNFAGAIMEMVMTLIYGGCVCIPSEEDRGSNLAQAIGKLNANWAFLTSTVLAFLNPQDVPSLRTICVGGEPIRSSQIREWAPKVHLRQTYGSAETAAVVSSASLSASSAVTNVGKATTARLWIVDPANVNQLVPIGAPGEVVLEGPVIGRHYIGEPEKSSRAFINVPSWRAALGPCTTLSRFYRTGDLATYRSDGSIELLGRKDTQVKLRGQRIELGEIEHQTRLSSSDVKEVAVELTVVGDRSNKGPQLVGFLVIGPSQEKINGEGLNCDERTRTVIQSVRTRLESVLPHYMVPSVFLPISTLPLTASGKTDRRRLREIGSKISAQQLEELQMRAEGQKRQPTTQVEQLLQKIWSQVLKIDPASIGLDDSFFQLGGDSITALKVVGEARKVGINLTMADIFRQDTLAELAHQQPLNIVQVSQQFDQDVLVEPSTKTSLLEEIDSLNIGIRSKDVADIYPVTSVQEMLLGASIRSGRLVDYFYIDIGSNLNLSVLENSCKRTLERFSILRSCFLRLREKSWQVVVRQVSQAFRVQDVSGDMDEYFQEFCPRDVKELSLTQPLMAFILLKHKVQGMRLVLRISHAQYDAFCVPLIFQSLFDDDNKTATSDTSSFSTLMSYASRRRPQSIAYWRELLQGSHPTFIRPKLHLPGSTQSSNPEMIVIQADAHLPHRLTKITAATIVGTAWAVLLSRISGTTDIVYGQVVAGRNAAIPGVEKIIGCCLNIIPVRVSLSSSGTVAELAHAVQEQFLALGEADTLSFGDIIKNCTDWPAGSSFQSVIHHRNIDENPEIQTSVGVSRMQSFSNRLIPPCIFVISASRGDYIDVRLVANTHIIAMETANVLHGGLVHIIEELGSCMHKSLSSWMDSIELAV